MKNIYALKDPFTGEIKYIGQTQNKLNVRIRGHRQKTPDGNIKKVEWFQSCVEKGKEPNIILLEVVKNNEADMKEGFYIEKYKDTILNVHSSGKKNTTIGNRFVCGHERKVGGYNDNGKLLMQFTSIGQAAKIMGCSTTCIINSCKGIKKKIKGYQWKYIDD